MTPPAYGHGMDQPLPSIDEMNALEGRDLERALAAVEHVRRQAEVLLASGVARGAATAAHRADGHRTVRAWQRATLDCSPSTALRVRRNGAVLAELPELQAACRRGEVGVDLLDMFGRLWANPRVRQQLRSDIERLLAVARGHRFDDAERLFRRWEALADADGAERSQLDAHLGRRASVNIVGEEGVVTAQGSSVEAILLREILQRFTDAEFEADVDAASRRLGRTVTASDLERTHRQRTFDALMNIFVTAATGAPAVIGIEPLVNIKLDQRTAEELLRKAAGQNVPRPSASEFLDRQCETIDGTPVPQAAALAAMLIGRVRGFVADERGVVTHLGRRSRLFRAGARDAAILQDLRCLWAGCDVPTGRCQTDHSTPWAAAGGTDPGNAGRGCGHHNRWKTRGYRTVRRNNGSWDIYRPDGSLIGEFVRAAA